MKIFNSWYDPGDRNILVEDVKILINFCKELGLEEEYEKKNIERLTDNIYAYETNYK